jgi:3-phenylpropionate/trans-cinnamate dioxygenase ferredoxin reductase subunit
VTCLIIGASHAGVQAATSLRNQAYRGPITMISADSVIPYQRPPLSKGFLQNLIPEEKLWIRRATFYAQKDIDLRLDSRVDSINREQKHVQLDTGIKLSYDKLIIATGASVRRLDIPGKQLNGIYYLRSYDDVRQIQKQLPSIKKVIIVGGGYVGLEAAASLRKLGKEVTILISVERPLMKVTGSVVSDYISDLHKNKGVVLKLNKNVDSFEGNDFVKYVHCSDGSRYQADMVIVGIGVIPEQRLAQLCGLQVNNGIHVNSFMQTSDPEIFAIGDCASFHHTIYQRRLRIESIQNATDQAKTAANAVCGTFAPYDCVPWFWSEQYNTKLQMAGLSAGHDNVVVRHAETDPDSFSVFYFIHNKLIAVDAINQPKIFMVTRKYLHTGPIVDKALLADNTRDITEAFVCQAGA